MPKTTRPRGRPATGAERRSISLPLKVWDSIEAAADGRPLSVEVGRLVEEGFFFRNCLATERELAQQVMDRIYKGDSFETPEMRTLESEISKAFRKKSK